MDIYDRSYRAVYLPNTTLGEALGIVWACGNHVESGSFETETDRQEFDRMWDAIFDIGKSNFGEVDRIDEKEYGDNAHRDDGEYCVRLSVISYAEDDWDDTHEYMISIGTDIHDMRPNIKVCFQRVYRKSDGISRSATFETLLTTYLDESMIDFLLQAK